MESDPTATRTAAPDAAAIAAHAEQISELRELVHTLAAAVQEGQTRTAQQAAFGDAVSEIRQAARMIAAGTVPAATRAGRGPDASGHGCDGGDCECTDSGCCAFDIVLSRVRATRPQIEPADAGDVPLLQNALEIRMFVAANRFGVLIPSFGSTLDLRADGVPPGPGPWVSLERVINRVQVKKGATQAVALHAEVEEDDSRLAEQATGAGKNEFGEASGSILVNCCMSEIYPPLPLTVELRHGGEGRGAVELLICARRVCC